MGSGNRGGSADGGDKGLLVGNEKGGEGLKSQDVLGGLAVAEGDEEVGRQRQERGVTSRASVEQELGVVDLEDGARLGDVDLEQVLDRGRRGARALERQGIGRDLERAVLAV